jgi:hypothetical protein
MISALFLQPLPVREADRLLLVMQRGAILNMPYGHSFPDYKDLREATTGDVSRELWARCPLLGTGEAVLHLTSAEVIACGGPL